MSETTDLVETGAHDAAGTTEAPAASGTTGNARRRGNGLSGMLLPELQRLAGELGISGTGRMRKGDLVAAISARQVGGGAGNSRPGDSAPDGPPSAAAAVEPAPVAAAPVAPPVEAPTAVEPPVRTRRGASRPAGAPAPEISRAPESAPAAEATEAPAPVEAEQRTEGDRPQRTRGRNRGERDVVVTNDRQATDRQGGTDRPANDRPANDRPANDRQGSDRQGSDR
ncbi:MAG: Rho termination factor N-terminal domain-containing protein, partial [Blastococcus sp.]